MDPIEIKKYYSQENVQNALLDNSKSREVSVRFINGGFGRRPDIIQYTGDVQDLVKKGATSFHISEERWSDPLQLQPGMNKKDLDKLRIGWDLILDIDTRYWDYAKYTTFLLIEALKFHNLKSISVKFSGNKGFHICVPFEAFPSEVNGMDTKDLFPESLRVIATYLQQMIKEKLATYILNSTDLDKIAEKEGKDKNEFCKNDKFDPFTIIDIDTILISNRHLFRAPYSLHEKSGLVSIPISIDNILTFDKQQAKPNNINFNIKFFPKTEKNDAKDLIIQAFDWYSKKSRYKENEKKEHSKKGFETPTIAVSEEFFPPCIKNILKGGLEDGKKRCIFILINFLRKMGWEWDKVQERLIEWNEKNPDSLRENYLLGQINWHKRKKENILPPNCSNASYYKDIRICEEENLCKRVKNPVNYTLIKLNAFKKNKKKPRKKRS